MPDTSASPVARVRADVASAELGALLAETGLVLVDDVAGPAGLLALASGLATIVPHRDSDVAGLTTITDLGGGGGFGRAGFTRCALDPHTDRSGAAYPPALLMMSCGQPAARGGDCVVVDGKAVYDDLVEHHPDAAEALRASRSALFGGAAGHLGSVFGSHSGSLSGSFSSSGTRWQ